LVEEADLAPVTEGWIERERGEVVEERALRDARDAQIWRRYRSGWMPRGRLAEGKRESRCRARTLV
jgi:hypothetical protein